MGWVGEVSLSSGEGAGAGGGHGMVATAPPSSTGELPLLRMWFSPPWKSCSFSALPLAWKAGPVCQSRSLWGEAAMAPMAGRGSVRCP